VAGNDENRSDYEVGYGRPPIGSRFRKGQSGNPKGRRKGSLNLATVLEKTLREVVVINEGGKRKTITKLEAAVKQLVNKAATGDLNAFRQLRDLVRSAEDRTATSESEKPELTSDDQKVVESVLKRFENSLKNTVRNNEDQL
jgi:phosphoenolpyruvate carboxylase